VARGFPAGILLYPISVLFLILIFPHRPDIAAAAWAVLAVGDGAATVVGQRVGRTRIPWNPEKTAEGSAAFFVLGSAAAVALAYWTRPAVDPSPSITYTFVAPILAAFVAALVETLPVRLDDNIAVPAAAAFTLWSVSLMTRDAWERGSEAVFASLLPALAVNGIAAWAGWRARAVSLAGAVVGAVIGVLIFACSGWAGWCILLAAFLSAAVSSRLGWKRKLLLGIAEERGGRRGPGNAIANCGVAAVAALLAVLTPHRQAALLVLVAALSAGASDTVASEIGKAWGRRTFLVTRFSEVKPGTSGAVSLEGTAAGLVSAFALAALALAVGLIHVGFIWFIVVGATVGSLVESVLGATLEAPGILNNDLLNFINTAVAGLVAVTLAMVVS
jgi:uncharacterized protein (TIGR00297 family)